MEEVSLDFYLEEVLPTEVFWRNITHNLLPMWDRAGVKADLYDSDGGKASDIIASLERGLKDMQDKPEEYEALNSPNGWGLYEHAVPFLKGVLSACKEHPGATIRISK